MARSAPRKSTKKCPSTKHGRKAHMRGGKRVKATCVMNRRKTMSKKSKGGKMRGMWQRMKDSFKNSPSLMM